MGNYARILSPTCLVEQEIWARQSAPPLYDDAMRTSHPYDEYMATLRSRMQSRPDDAQDAPTVRPDGAGVVRGVAPASNESPDALDDSEAEPEVGRREAGLVNVGCDVEGDVELLLTHDEGAHFRRHSRTSASTSSAPDTLEMPSVNTQTTAAELSAAPPASGVNPQQTMKLSDAEVAKPEAVSAPPPSISCDSEAFDDGHGSSAVIPALKARLGLNMASADPLTQPPATSFD